MQKEMESEKKEHNATAVVTKYAKTVRNSNRQATPASTRRYEHIDSTHPPPRDGAGPVVIMRRGAWS